MFFSILSAMVEIIFACILFLLFLFFCLYLPGKFLLGKLQIELSSLEDIFVPYGVGLVLFTLIAYALSWINLEVLILPLLLSIDFFVIKNKHWHPKKIEKKHFIPLFSVFVLSIIFALSMLIVGKFGDMINYRRDDLWHLALINELKAHFPPDNPGFAQVPLKGYHFFYNFVVAKISNIFFISPYTLHFHLVPLLLALSWGFGVYTLLLRWSKKIPVALWGVFLTQFGGGFAYLLQFQGHTMVSLNNGLGISQATGALNNPPFAISIIIVITALFAFYHYTTTKQKRWLVPLVLCVGMVSMFKVYAGIILVGGFLALTLLELLKKRFIILVALCGVGGLFLGTYWVFGSGAGYLIYYPLWPPHTLLQSFPWYGYDEKIYTYTQNNVLSGIVKTELYGLMLFILGNLGTRLVGILLLPLLFLKKYKKPSSFSLILISMILVSLLLPLFFIQSGKVFEIIQMGWYYLFFCALFAAFGLGVLWELKYHKLLKIGIVVMVVLATLPSAYSDYVGYWNVLTTPQSLLSPKFQAFTYLSRQADYDATVLELPPQSVGADENGLRSWYNFSTPAIVAFANKRAYLNNEFIEFPGVNLKQRMKLIEDMILFNTTAAISSADMRESLITNKIHYIYSTYPLKSIGGVTKVYEKGNNFVYQVANQ